MSAEPGGRADKVAESPSHDSSHLSDEPLEALLTRAYEGVTPRDVFLAERLPAYLAAGRHSLVLFEYEHSSWQAAAERFGHAASDAAVAEVVLRLRSGLARADEWSALGYFHYATMLAGDDFADQVRAVRECVKQASWEPIVWDSFRMAAPRVVSAVTIVAEPSQVSSAELIYVAASLLFGPGILYERDGVIAWIHKQGSWDAFYEARPAQEDRPDSEGVPD